MRLTTKSRYGTRLVLDIAVYGGDKPVPLSDVSFRQNISMKYLEQLAGKLNKTGILKSQRGSCGGYMLAKPPESITMGDIVRDLEGSSAITDCAERGAFISGICNQEGDCLSKWVWIEASRAMFVKLDSITVAYLLSRDHQPSREIQQ